MTSTPSRLSATVLLLFGDQAELVIPEKKFTHENPLRVPVIDITAATGLDSSQLPGRRLTALVSETPEDGVRVSAYELA